MKKHLSIQTQIVSVLVLFIIVVLLIVAAFQTFFLDDFYLRSKVLDMKNVTQNMIYHLGNDELEKAMQEASYSNEVCVRIVTANGLSFTSFNQKDVCALNYVNDYQMREIIETTIENGDEYLFEDFKLALAPYDTKDLFIYSKAAILEDVPVFVLVSSMIEPLNATVETMRSQYIFIAFIVIVATVIMGIALSKMIIKPINQLKEESKNLPKGKYDGEKVYDRSLEIEELNNTLTEANIEINRSEKTRKELLSNVSHDLRTPLTMIVGYGEMIRDLKEENNEDNINVIIDEAKRLSSLVDDLLDVSYLENHKLVLHKEAHSINDLLLKVYNQYEKHFEGHNIDFRLEIGEDYKLEFDQKRLMQVLYNFLNNAFNYNDAEHKVIILKGEVKENTYRISVYDNGRGIEKEALDLVWDRYYKVDKEHKRSALGSGIGLSLCKELLEAHKFEYGVESEIENYSLFYFDIPINL